MQQKKSCQTRGRAEGPVGTLSKVLTLMNCQSCDLPCVGLVHALCAVVATSRCRFADFWQRVQQGQQQVQDQHLSASRPSSEQQVSHAACWLMSFDRCSDSTGIQVQHSDRLGSQGGQMSHQQAHASSGKRL